MQAELTPLSSSSIKIPVINVNVILQQLMTACMELFQQILVVLNQLLPYYLYKSIAPSKWRKVHVLEIELWQLSTDSNWCSYSVQYNMKLLRQLSYFLKESCSFWTQMPEAAKGVMYKFQCYLVQQQFQNIFVHSSTKH